MSAFKTKFTVGLLTITPCPQNDPTTTITDIEEKSPEVLAVEQAARDAIAKKKARKVLRSKSRSQSPNSKNKNGVRRTRSGKKPASRSNSPSVTKPRQEVAAPEPVPVPVPEPGPSKEELEAAAAAAKKAQEEAEAEEARKKAEEEAAEAARLTAEEEAALAALEAMLASPEEEKEEEQVVEPIRSRPRRRISMFPACKANTGLTDAVKRYGNDAPFDWENPEWTKEHVNLKHTSTINNTYGWETPEWAQRNLLRKTQRGDKVKQGENLEGSISSINANKRVPIARCHSMTGRSLNIPPKGHIQFHKPFWAKRSILRNTELGEAARQGLKLEVSVSVIKSLVAGGDFDLSQFDGSCTSLDVSGKHIVWDKPSWAIDPNLKTTETGMAVRQGANLALPVTELKVKGTCNASAFTSTCDSTAATSSSGGDGFVGSPHNSNISQRTITWGKPTWAMQHNLRRTSKGEKMKEAGNLAQPITPKN